MMDPSDTQQVDETNFERSIPETTDRFKERRKRRASPRWSEEAVRGSCESTSRTATATQANFNAWLEEQSNADTASRLWRTDTPEQMTMIDEWLEHQQVEDVSTGTDTDPRYVSSYAVSTDTSPLTAPDFSHSPHSAFAGAPAMFPSPGGVSLPAWQPVDPAQGGMGGFYTPQAQVAHHSTDLIGVGSFVEPGLPNTNATVTRRPLKYKPLSTWFHLWVT